MTTTIDRADATVQSAAADIINRMLAEDGLGETITSADVHSLGCASRGIDRATYHLNAMARFTILAEVSQPVPRQPIQVAIIVRDSRSYRSVKETIRPTRQPSM